MPAALLIGLALTAILILGIGFLGWTNKQGFLGTYAPIIADVNLIVQIALLGLLMAGLIEIKRKKNTEHRYLLTAVVLFSVVLTIFIMAGRFFLLYSPGNFGWQLIVHGILGLTAIVIGIYLMLLMDNRLEKRWRMKKWKLLMRVNWALFLLVTLGGFVIYWRMYIP
jgi:uncharacterized membrane protein YozB (DUF420 family)